MTNPTGAHINATDEYAGNIGFTKEVLLDSDLYTFNALVKPDADLGDRFKAWDMDEQEFIWVNGWLFCSETISDPEGDLEELLVSSVMLALA